MNLSRLVFGGILLWLGITAHTAADELPPAVQEVLKQLETEAAEVDRETQTELNRWREKAAVALKEIQDNFCRLGQLDEAVAVRDLLKTFRTSDGLLLTGSLPASVRRSVRTLEAEAEAILRKGEDKMDAREEKATKELQKMQEAFCKEAKLDEALAVREVLKNLRTPATATILPDPHFIGGDAANIGKVTYYETTGANTFTLYGTDVYTTGSHLGTVAVHSGVLRVGEKGVVKVTMLPGQQNYPGTTRNGVTSVPYSQWHISFKVERATSFHLRRGATSSLMPNPPNPK